SSSQKTVVPTGSSVSQEQLNQIVAAATNRWMATGLSQDQVNAIREIQFQVGDLNGSYLAKPTATAWWSIATHKEKAGSLMRRPQAIPSSKIGLQPRAVIRIRSTSRLVASTCLPRSNTKSDTSL